MVFGIAVCLIAWVLGAAPAAAQWRTMSDENDFDKVTTHFAMGFSGDEQLVGFRCESGQKNPTIVYISEQEMPAEAVSLARAQASRLKMEIWVVIDKEPKVVLPALPEAVPDSNKVRFVSALDDVSLVRKMSAAKDRLSVGVAITGELLSRAKFGVTGSKKAITGTLEACGFKS